MLLMSFLDHLVCVNLIFEALFSHSIIHVSDIRPLLMSWMTPHIILVRGDNHKAENGGTCLFKKNPSTNEQHFGMGA